MGRFSKKTIYKILFIAENSNFSCSIFQHANVYLLLLVVFGLFWKLDAMRGGLILKVVVAHYHKLESCQSLLFLVFICYQWRALLTYTHSFAYLILFQPQDVYKVSCRVDADGKSLCSYFCCAKKLLFSFIANKLVPPLHIDPLFCLCAVYNGKK